MDPSIENVTKGLALSLESSAVATYNLRRIVDARSGVCDVAYEAADQAAPWVAKRATRDQLRVCHDLFSHHGRGARLTEAFEHGGPRMIRQFGLALLDGDTTQTPDAAVDAALGDEAEAIKAEPEALAAFVSAAARAFEVLYGIEE